MRLGGQPMKPPTRFGRNLLKRPTEPFLSPKVPNDHGSRLVIACDPPHNPGHGKMSQACIPFPMISLTQLAQHATQDFCSMNSEALVGSTRGPAPVASSAKATQHIPNYVSLLQLSLAAYTSSNLSCQSFSSIKGTAPRKPGAD